MKNCDRAIPQRCSILGRSLTCSNPGNILSCVILCTASWPLPSVNSCLEKSFNFRKLKKSLNCFGKKSGRLWKVWNLLSWKFQQDSVTVQTSCHNCWKAGIRTAKTVLLLNVAHECLKSVYLFLDYQWAAFYWMIEWKKSLELASNYWMKRPRKVWKIFRTSGTGTLCIVLFYIIFDEFIIATFRTAVVLGTCDHCLKLQRRDCVDVNVIDSECLVVGLLWISRMLCWTLGILWALTLLMLSRDVMINVAVIYASTLNVDVRCPEKISLHVFMPKSNWRLWYLFYWLIDWLN